MQKIERKYAIIYIDYDGETLTLENFTTKDMISEYYKNPGFLQWNFYLIIPEERLSNHEISDIENNDIYTRKFVIKEREINNFLDKRFPVMKENIGKVKLIKGENFEDSHKKLVKTIDHEDESYLLIQESIYRDKSLMDTLTEMDKLRALLIKQPKYKLFYFTHIETEYHLAEKKFKLFT